MSDDNGAAPILQVEDIHTFYGAIEALKGISLEVYEGEIVTLIGSNGAGKTTTLRSISGIVAPRQGAIYYLGNDITGMPGHQVASIGIAQSPEGRRIFPRMTVLENLEMGAFTRKDNAAIRADVERVYEMFPRLKERRGQQAGTLSGGEQQMLAVGRAMMLRPRLMLLDEPSFGLAPLIVEELFGILRTLNKNEKVSMLLVEQNAALALDLADHAYLIETGRLVTEGPARQLRDDENIRRSYLGY